MRSTILTLLACTAATAAAEMPVWQQAARFTPWKVGEATAFTCLGTTVELSRGKWPRLLRRQVPWHSIQRWQRKGAEDWARNKSFGFVQIDRAAPKSMKDITVKNGQVMVLLMHVLIMERTDV